MMFVIIKDGKKIIPKFLNETDTVSYKGISIYPNNAYHYLYLKPGYCLDDGRKSCRLAPGIYHVDVENACYQILLYVYGDDKGYQQYDFYHNTDNVRIAYGSGDITLTDSFAGKGELRISCGVITGDLDFSINGKQYDGFRLNDGDLIECLGLRIFYYEKFLYINRFLSKISLKPYHLSGQLIRYGTRKRRIVPVISRTYEELIIPETEAYEEAERKSQSDVLRTILPNSIMTCSIIAVSAVSLYNSYMNGNSIMSSLTYVITPSAMLMTGVFLPVFFYRKEKKEDERRISESRNSYLDYLSAYEKEVDRRVEDYLKQEKERFFSLEDLKKEPFSIRKNDPDFMKICLGEIYQEEPFLCSGRDKQIDDVLKGIQRKLSYIGPLPLMLDLKENKRVTIISKASEKSYFFLHFLLELSFRHSYEDLGIAVYSKNQDLISDFYDLPHLFHNERRLFCYQERQLQELDMLKLDHPLVLFMDEKSDYVFSNPLISVIYFSDDSADLYKDSDCVAEYLNQTGTLYNGEKKTFAYTKQLCDFAKVFHLLGSYNDVFQEKDDISFQKLFSDFDIRESYRSLHRDLRCDFAWHEEQLLFFDLHESRQGPHGLIAGSTGSGKSELIISMLLALCIRYSPQYLNIVLIDYKGGGIEESLSYEGNRLPHIIASLSNLENYALQRLIIALRNECISRQKLFRILAEKSGISVMNLDDYLSSRPEAYDLERIAHLLIVVDEFAELKKENPEAIRELISISRIGRSLGIHLILATQKPSGNIDDEIFSNSRFKIALKTFEERDSVDIIRSKDAAYLKKPGSFLLRVDESLIGAQSIYAKRDAEGKEPYEVSLLDGSLDLVKKNTLARGRGISEASYFVSKIISVVKELNIPEKKLDYSPPEPMERKNLIRGRCFVFGEGDDYLNSIRKPVAYGMNENILICSDRKKEICSLLNTLAENQKQCVLIGHIKYENEFISDYFHYSETAEIDHLLKILSRKDPKLCLLIEDLPVFLSYDDSYQEKLLKLLKRSESMNFSIVCFSSSVQLSYKLIAAFRRKILIGVNDKNDISYLFGSRSSYEGNSFYYEEEAVCFVPIRIEEFVSGERKISPLVTKIPEELKAVKNENGCLLGFDAAQRKELFIDHRILITSFDEDALDLYRKAYGEDMEIVSYDPKLPPAEEFLWIGPGIFSQRLFFTDLREDPKEDEAIYFHLGRKTLLKRITHA